MKKEQLFDTLTELDDQLLEQYFSMDEKLARKHTRRRIAMRVLAVAACVVLLLGVSLPVGFMVAHPAGKAIAAGDSAALTEQLNRIEGFKAWQERTAERLEQSLPEPVWELLQTTPIMDVLTQSQYPDYALKNQVFVPYAAGDSKPEVQVYYLDDKSEHFNVPGMIDVTPERYTHDSAPESFVLDHEGGRYELKYAYSLTQSIDRQAVDVYELLSEQGLYSVYLDAKTGECIYWSSPKRTLAESESEFSKAELTQRAYDMLAQSVRDPEEYQLLTSVEDGLLVCKFVRTFRGTYDSQVKYQSKSDLEHPTVHSCDCATFAFDAAGNMVCFDLAYLGALRNADKEVPAVIYTLSKDYCRSSYFHTADGSYVCSIQDTEYEVIIKPDGGLALNHVFSLTLWDGNTASIGYIVPMTAGKAELAHLAYKTVELPDGPRVLMSETVWTEEDGEVRIEYQYDATGILIGKTANDEVTTYTYDEQGFLTEERVENLTTPELGRGTRYIYNVQGLVYRKDQLDYQGYATGAFTRYEYDDQGRVIYEWVEQGGEATVITYTYGEYGSYVSVTEKQPVGTQYKTEVTKNETGKVIHEAYYVNDQLTEETGYTYDAEGRLVKIEQFEGGVLQTTTTYQFNTAPAFVFTDGKTYQTSERVLFDIEEYVDGKLVRFHYERYNQYGELVYYDCSYPPNGHEKLVHTIKWDYGYLGE